MMFHARWLPIGLKESLSSYGMSGNPGEGIIRIPQALSGIPLTKKSLAWGVTWFPCCCVNWQPARTGGFGHFGLLREKTPFRPKTVATVSG